MNEKFILAVRLSMTTLLGPEKTKNKQTKKPLLLSSLKYERTT